MADQEEITAPAASEQTEKPTDKWSGKSPEELVNALKEFESQTGRQGQELGELKKKLTLVEEEQRRREYEQNIQKMYAKQEETRKPELAVEEDDPDATFDYTKPGKSAREIARKEFQKEFERHEKQRQEYDKQVQLETAKKNYMSGFNRAIKANPDIYDGIQKDTQDIMYQSFVTGRLNADDLADERIWEKTAQLIWIEKGNVEKLVKKSIEPVKAMDTGNIPNATREMTSGGGKSYNFDEKTYELMKAFKLTEEQAKQVIESERNRKGE